MRNGSYSYKSFASSVIYLSKSFFIHSFSLIFCHDLLLKHWNNFDLASLFSLVSSVSNWFSPVNHWWRLSLTYFFMNYIDIRSFLIQHGCLSNLFNTCWVSLLTLHFDITYTWCCKDFLFRRLVSRTFILFSYTAYFSNGIRAVMDFSTKFLMVFSCQGIKLHIHQLLQI